MAPSEFDAAFQDLQREFEGVTGRKQTVKIDGKNYPAIVDDVTFDALITAGGEGDEGGFVVEVAIADLPKKPISGKGMRAEARGQECDILTVANINGTVWRITCGFFAAE